MAKYANQCIKVFQKKLNTKLNLREQTFNVKTMNKLIPKIYHTSQKKSTIFKGFLIINHVEKNTLTQLSKRSSTNSFEKEENY